ncbi:Plasmodium exported protein, unknown function [Plasmodium gonderi]|uniref:Pv-fam-d protein n=1 Tax=Plasmodium gonderi TaxID=77519 RepID=A0A1Y1JPA4_PLAGO|nr:Plasmodium exported protein, unknown function [Plasmodium gonderi]GAW84321.1 Plasmodium exported protein, unknown function [Plasmodium gonderi]
MFFPTKAVIFSLLICIHCRESSNISVTFHNESNINNSLNKKRARLLHERAIVERQRQQRYVDLQRRVETLLNEDNIDFAKRLKASSLDDHFVRHFNAILQNGLFERRNSVIINNKNFQKFFNASLHKRKKTSFNTLNDYDNNDQGNMDPFKYYSNLEEYFDDLKSIQYNKTKLIEELKRNMYRNEKFSNTFRYPNPYEEKPCGELGLDVHLKLRKHEHLKGPRKYNMHEGFLEHQDTSKLPSFINNENVHSDFDLIMRRLSKGKSFIEGKIFPKHASKYRKIFNLIMGCSAFGVIGSLALGAFLISAIFITLVTLLGSVLIPAFLLYMPFLLL